MARLMQRIGALLGIGLLVLSCKRSESADGGSESLVCSASEVDCGDGCVSLVANAAHCGACDSPCLPGQICVGMTCLCPGGGTLCEGECVATTHDAANCGRCGNQCPAGHECWMGVCYELQSSGSGGNVGWWTDASGGAAAGGAPAGGAGDVASRPGGAGSTGPDAAGGQGPGGAGGSQSLGCGASNPPGSGRYTIDVAGDPREYIIDLPSGYAPDRPYALVVAWHWFGGTAEHVASGVRGSLLGPYYGLQEVAQDTAIFVAPEGIDNGWANPRGRDVAFARELIDRLRAELCIDTDRIFSTGFSYGGMMSNAIGCAMGDVFRAIAPVAGSLQSGCERGTAPIAMWSAHGIYDDDVPIDAGRQARDEFLDRNGCPRNPVPTNPSPCVLYDGCTSGAPVVWCEWEGGHELPAFAPPAIWDFFTSLE